MKAISNFFRSRTFCTLSLVAIALATAVSAHAAGNGLSGINEATSMVTSYFDPGV